MNRSSTDQSASSAYGLGWKAIADGWARLGDGNHPSPYAIKMYERFLLESLASIAEPRVLLLGATPELRDMFAKHPELGVTLLDLNREMIGAMTSLMKTKATLHEEHVVGNWVDPKFPDNHFHAILGDQVNMNVPFTAHKNFYENMRRILAPSGAYISRLSSRFPNTILYNPDQLVSHFSEVPLSKASVTEFLNKLMFFSSEESVATTDRMYTLLEKYGANANIRAYTEEFLRILPRGKSWHIGRWEEERKIILNYFEMINLVPDPTYVADSTYVFHFKPKNK